MDKYILCVLLVGLMGLAVSWVPSIAKKINISYSIIFLIFGIILYSYITDLPWPNPYSEEEFTVRLTEMVVIIALMGTGLKIDQRFTFRRWKIPFRLIFITMLISIAAMAAFSFWGLGFSLASSILIGAVLAPTDPVLAADVQVAPPNQGNDDEVRFSLTAEAGLNDGMAFPFVWLAIVLAASGQYGSTWLVDWVWKDLIYRISVGVIMGFAVGRIITYLYFKLPYKHKMLEVRDGLVALSTTLFVYGATEMVQGYGFVAVFIAAITMRNYEQKHKYHTKLHDFTDQIERILLAVLLVLFGGSLVSGILNSLTWQIAMIGLAFVFIVRPVAAMAALVGVNMQMKKKLAVSFFGIKGIGSFFYLAFALKAADFTDAEELWSLTAFVVLISILVHGLSAPIVMKKLGLNP